jgi:CRP/FNR family transcriptional regulator, cyclic AMP receptor protein
MTNSAVVSALAQSELFGGLGASDRERLADECRIRRYLSGENIFARGDTGTTMYLVGQGAVALTITAADGGTVVLAVLHPPQTFGELTLIDNGARIATATAREPTVLIVIPGTAVTSLIQTDPAFALAMLSALARLVRRVDDHAADLVLLDLRARIVKYLAAEAQAVVAESPADSRATVDLRLTQTELARLVGGSRQQVNRIIVALEREGALERRGARIVAVRPDRLDLPT